ncbi:alpha/beta hydrolase-fold protein [Paenibacillus sp. SC116]|uniref:alpha/beta hydrolase n=1 Tax=Paenibacillus sp. SC116 TaxID=2968986 RepID=UPI00215B19B3|nr:alpha/beta hydrolase-fold protein [Paenibacillus sp. SC116]MCR8843557.1 alpha/beta hydrolase-fold protein [Paenibacillus sp. SC116]
MTMTIQENFGERHLTIYLPEGYEESTDRYPVIYMQDNADLIDPEGSDSLSIIRTLTAKGELPAFLFVGIKPFDRNDEYTPFVSTNVFESGEKKFGGQAAQYAAYLANELKPYIDSCYRTLPDSEHTGIMGFSFGGLISVYTALLYPDVFGKIGSFSGSFWFPGIVDWVDQQPARNHEQRIFMNVGHGEGAGRTNGQQWMVPNNLAIHEILLSKGFTEQTAKQIVYESDSHSFEKGVQYLPEALKWLYVSK